MIYERNLLRTEDLVLRSSGHQTFISICRTNCCECHKRRHRISEVQYVFQFCDLMLRKLDMNFFSGHKIKISVNVLCYATFPCRMQMLLAESNVAVSLNALSVSVASSVCGADRTTIKLRFEAFFTLHPKL
jgi:hypothetical protein